MDPPMEAERTNGETLIWVQSLKGYGQATLKSAKSFMNFDGDHRQLKSWKERFLMEHKKIFFYIYCCPFGPTRAQLCQGYDR